jgi:type IV pilus assembly protein PilC
MHAYQYRAIDRRGRIHNGVADANGAADLEARLDRLDLELLSCRKQGTGLLKLMSRGISRRDLIVFCYHLEQTCRAGVPILESLTDLRDSTGNSRLRGITAAMIMAIEGGRTLAGAMQDHPAVFNGVFCSLISAGERSGKIAEIFCSIGENLKWQDEQAALAKKLLAYPLLVSVVVTGVIFFLMIYLVPEMLQFVRLMGQEIPLHTRALIVVSRILVNYWYVFLCAPLLLAVVVCSCVRASPAARYYLDALTLRLPLVGAVCRKIILARVTRFMAMMYASGITIIECITAGEKIAGNRVFAEAMRRTGEALLAGASLGRSLEQAEMFPPMALRMIRIGENTGTLEQSLLGICYFYTRDVRESIERLQAMIEPAMTLFLGGVIGWIMFSILGPIYDLIAHVRV